LCCNCFRLCDMLLISNHLVQQILCLPKICGHGIFTRTIFLVLFLKNLLPLGNFIVAKWVKIWEREECTVFPRKSAERQRLSNYFFLCILEGIYPFLNFICTNASKKAAQYYNRQHASLQSISNTTKALFYYII
jgi:hypothetical protein